MGSVKNNLKISKISLIGSIIVTFISFLFFCFYPYSIIAKVIDIDLTWIMVSAVLMVYFGNQRDHPQKHPTPLNQDSTNKYDLP